MQQHIYYIKFALRFADMQIPELVNIFNAHEFQRRGIDISAVYDGKAITFARPVRYDIADNRLTTIG